MLIKILFLATAASSASVQYTILPVANKVYYYTDKLANGILTLVQQSTLTNYPVTAIRSSVSFNNMSLVTDQVTP